MCTNAPSLWSKGTSSRHNHSHCCTYPKCNYQLLCLLLLRAQVGMPGAKHRQMKVLPLYFLAPVCMCVVSSGPETDTFCPLTTNQHVNLWQMLVLHADQAVAREELKVDAP